MERVLLYDKKFINTSLARIFKDFSINEDPADKCQLLLRWGNLKGEDHHASSVLNRKLPLKNGLDKEKVFEILRINRVRRPKFVVPGPESPYPLVAKPLNVTTVKSQEKIVRIFSELPKSGAYFFVEHLNLLQKYKAYIFDFNLFCLAKKVRVKTNSQKIEPRWEYEELPKDLDKETQKISILAQRALYVLGLDFGLVHMGIDVKGRAVVLDVTPVPYMSLSIGERFLKLVNKHHKGTPKRDVLLGADPEFILRNSTTGKIVYPSDFIKKEGVLGYDERSEGRAGRFYPLAEVRPKPDFSPLKLTENIRSILVTAASIFPPDTEWLAGSVQFGQYHIGGHIHFSHIDLNNKVLRALDNYLGIPLFLLEDPDTSALRRRQYGWLGSVRYKSHGGFEYRTPGSWLVTPEITKATLCLSKIIATEYEKLPLDFFVDIGLQKAFYQGKKMYFYDLFHDLWRDIKRTVLYEAYQEHLKILPDIIERGEIWDEKNDFRKAWGLIKK